MSLLRPIIRSCVVASLRDRTWAEERVYDTDMRALAEAVLGAAAKPYITVFTDGDDRPVLRGTRLYDDTEDERQLSVTVEIGVASSVRAYVKRELSVALSGIAETQVQLSDLIPETTPPTGTINIQCGSGSYKLVNYTSYSGSTFTIPATDFTADPAPVGNLVASSNIVLHFAETDEGMEWAVDIIEDQVKAAMLGDPQSEWGELLKHLAFRWKRLSSRRGGQHQQGVRFAARRIVFQCTTIDDIVPGIVLPADHPVRTFITMANANPQVGQVDAGGIVEKLLASTEAPHWRIAQAYLGLTKEGAEYLMDEVPLPDPGVEEPPLDYSDTNEYPPPLEDVELTDITTDPIHAPDIP